MERIYTKKVVFILAGSVAICYPVFNLAINPAWHDRRTYPEKTAIITGGTGNLAGAMAYQFSLRKVRVILACRDIDKCRSMRREIVVRTGHKGMLCRHLDLEDVDSINKFVKDISETEPHIDILVNNAAVKRVEKKELTKYGIEKNYFVNFLAPFLLTFRLYDKLKETAAVTKDVRIINIVGAPRRNWTIDLDDINFDKRPYTPKAAYRQSKLALAHFTILLDKFNKDQKNSINVYATNPGSNKIMSAFEENTNLLSIPRLFISNSPDMLIMNVIRCALEPKLSDGKKTGLLYSHLMSPKWGWHGVDKREMDGKLVWNAAKQTLLNLQEMVPEKSAEGQSDTNLKSNSDKQQLEDAKNIKDK